MITGIVNDNNFTERAQLTSIEPRAAKRRIAVSTLATQELSRVSTNRNLTPSVMSKLRQQAERNMRESASSYAILLLGNAVSRKENSSSLPSPLESDLKYCEGELQQTGRLDLIQTRT